MRERIETAAHGHEHVTISPPAVRARLIDRSSKHALFGHALVTVVHTFVDLIQPVHALAAEVRCVSLYVRHHPQTHVSRNSGSSRGPGDPVTPGSTDRNSFWGHNPHLAGQRLPPIERQHLRHVVCER